MFVSRIQRYGLYDSAVCNLSVFCLRIINCSKYGISKYTRSFERYILLAQNSKPPKVVISEKTEVTGLGGFSVFKAVEENSLAKRSAKVPAIKGFRARGVKGNHAAFVS